MNNFTNDNLLEVFDFICAKARSLILKKNHDYTAGANDIFANLRSSEILGIPKEKGTLVRLLDKLTRMNAFASVGELQMKDENVVDTAVDIVNYTTLIISMFVADGKIKLPQIEEDKSDDQN